MDSLEAAGLRLNTVNKSRRLATGLLLKHTYNLDKELFALVCDFFIDVYFLQGLSTDTLIDVRFIHFEYGALLAMVCFEFSAFLCLPITAFVFYKVFIFFVSY